MPKISTEATSFISELDAAVEAHIDWTRRVLRCAVLGTSPGDDVLAEQAHSLCRFGRWFALNQEHFEKLDAPKTRQLTTVHRQMHDAIRAICAAVLAGHRGQGGDIDVFERTQSELINLLAEFKTKILTNAARYDPVTGLPLRYGVEIEFLQVQKICARNRTLLYLVIIDADHFKRVNDNHGHPVGDLALRHLASTLKHVARAAEPLFRFGGEEFLLLMQCHASGDAAIAAQRIVRAVRDAPLSLPQGGALPLTVTLGLARVGVEEDMASAVERADKALYAGKHAGRDRYVIADS